MKAKIIDIDGKTNNTIELPSVFETAYKPKLIRRAVLAIQTAKLQPKGADKRAGFKTTAIYIGTRGKPTPMRTINTDKARLPRKKNRTYLLYGNVARIAQSVGGRSPTAPKSQKVIVEKINKKEKQLALKSAIAASINKELVSQRFIFENDLPIIIEDKFEDTIKTKDIVDILTKIGVGKDLENAKNKIRKRAGKGKARGRVRKVKKSVLIVTGNNKPVLKASRNLPGVEAVTAKSLNVELLAPGAEAGRLVVWTRSAIEAIGGKKEASTHHKIKKEQKLVLKEKKKTVKSKRKEVLKTKKKTKKEGKEE